MSLRTWCAHKILTELPPEEWLEAWQGALRYIVWLEMVSAGRVGV